MAEWQTHTLIIGASISGLACAASFQKRGINYLVIEKEGQIASPWRNHYERLHLHTSKHFSTLPFRKYGRTIPRYPSRLQVLDYLENYKAAFDISPIYNSEAVSVKKESVNGSLKQDSESSDQNIWLWLPDLMGNPGL